MGKELCEIRRAGNQKEGTIKGELGGSICLAGAGAKAIGRGKGKINQKGLVGEKGGP